MSQDNITRTTAHPALGWNMAIMITHISQFNARTDNRLPAPDARGKMIALGRDPETISVSPNIIKPKTRNHRVTTRRDALPNPSTRNNITTRLNPIQELISINKCIITLRLRLGPVELRIKLRSMQVIHHPLKSNNKNRVGYALIEVKYARIFSAIIKDDQPSIANYISMMPSHSSKK
ncbi:MAG: hypothetical protein VKI63_07725 [Cyanobium sp.]|nr:hypothetical protein [Cyanobium sp.]